MDRLLIFAELLKRGVLMVIIALVDVVVIVLRIPIEVLEVIRIQLFQVRLYLLLTQDDVLPQEPQLRVEIFLRHGFRFLRWLL